MTKTPWIIGAALATTLAASAFAQGATGPGHEGPSGPPKTRAELQAKIADQFKKVDVNGDGYVTKAEADTARDAMKAKFAEHRAERRDRQFAKLDTDKDGKLSKAEFAAPSPPRDGKGGPRADRDRGGPDGHHWGHRGGRGPGGDMMAMGGRWFERADANKDGKVSLAEAQAGPLARFDKIDTNKDGTISPEERDAARAAMRGKWQDKRGDAAKG